MKGFKWQNLMYAVGFAVAYFVLLRVVRIWISLLVIFPLASHIDDGRENGFTVLAPESQTGIYVYQNEYLRTFSERMNESSGGPVGMASYGQKPYYVFKGFGDQFFLFAGFVLIVMGAFRQVMYLYGYHVGISIVNALLLLVGVYGYEVGLRVMDFNIEYLTPAVSLLWIIAIYSNWKRSPAADETELAA